MKHKKYEYIIDGKEISEFSTKSFLEQFKNNKKIWCIRILLILFLLLLYPGAAVFFMMALALLYLIIFISIRSAMKKALSGKQWTVWIEDGRIKAFRDANYSEISCKSMELVRITRRLLMLGYMLPDKRAAWIVLPLRIFADAMEREEFLELFYNSLEETEEKTEKETETANVQKEECLEFSYMLNENRWVRFQMEAADMIYGGTFGKKLVFGTGEVFLLAFIAMLALYAHFFMGHFGPLIIVYSVVVMIICLLRKRYKSPEKMFRKQAESSAVKDWECGLRRVSLDERGIEVCLPRGKNFYRWESMEWLGETEDAFFIFRKDKGNYVVIAKESFQDMSRVDMLYGLCGQKGIKKAEAKRRPHIPDWLFTLALTAAFVSCMVCVVTGVFGDAAKRMERNREFLENEMEQETEGKKTGQIGDIQKNSDTCLQLESWVETLESTGLHVSEEAVDSVRTAITEYDLLEAVESDPYTWLLMNMAAEAYDEEGTIREYSKELFWFDFEGMDLTTDYEQILKGMLALSEGSCLDEVEDVQVNTDNVDWEKGGGSIEISFSYKGRISHFDMDVDYDWIDSKVLGIFNSLLEPEESGKLFYATWDGGQGAIVFFCTKEWKEQFEAKTGLELMCY